MSLKNIKIYLKQSIKAIERYLILYKDILLKRSLKDVYNKSSFSQHIDKAPDS